MKYKSYLILLVILVVLTFFVLQFFTTAITGFGNGMLESIGIGNLNVFHEFKSTKSNKVDTNMRHTFENRLTKKYLRLSQRGGKIQRHQKTMRILFWGTFYEHSPRLENYCIMDEKSMSFCQNRCEYSVDQSELNANQSDAIVIHGRESELRFPRYRLRHQHWVFLMFESPDNSWINISEWNNIFDWTMSYRRDSDVFIPYGKLIPRSENKDDSQENQFSENFGLVFIVWAHFVVVLIFRIGINRLKKLAAIAISNCQLVTSERKAIVDELSKFIPIDVYGACGLYLCPGVSRLQCDNPQKCFEYLGNRYKFYLAFENSICDDYITEKFFLALANGMVPVVHGPKRETYLKHAPAHSFIHVEDFPNLKDLAVYLTQLDKNEQEYMEYLSWRGDYALDKIYYFQRAWCTLCNKLHEKKTTNTAPVKPKTLYSSVSDWWFYARDVKSKICQRIVVHKNATFEYQGIS